MKKIQQVRLYVILASLVVGLLIFFMAYVLNMAIQTALSVYLVMLTILFSTIHFLESVRLQGQKEIEEYLDKGLKEVLIDAKVGILIYDEKYFITFMSNYLLDNVGHHLGTNLLSWLPGLKRLLNGESEEEILEIREIKYLISKHYQANALTFRDISKEYDLEKKFAEDAVVLGLVNFDNYDEISEIEDDLAYVNATIRPSVYEYFKAHNLVYKNLRNNRVLLFMNERQFKDLLDDHFSILNIVRKEAKKGDIEMTLSMAFARGNDNLQELDANVSSLLEIAQTRGGDQVVVRKEGEEAIFYGGSSEAKGKRSKVRVRVYANTLKNLFLKSSNVIICGHLEADSDCIGSAICMSVIARNYVAETCIITKSGGVEKTTLDVLNKYNNELSNRHTFVTESEAINRLKDDSLVIMVDHHSASQSGGEHLLKMAKRIVIIDHHRRKVDLDTNPILVYIEAGASSACELTCEFLPYLLKKGNITPLEANLMYLGMIIDTNHFRVRTGERTFEAARNLRSFGADPNTCEEWIREPFNLVKQVSHIVEIVNLEDKGIAIAALEEDNIYARSIIAQACDQIVNMKEVRAAFVLARTSADTLAISARSDASVNVQVIMEKMKGGGHLTGAGVQRKEGTIADLLIELKEAIALYFNEEEKENESDFVK